MLSIGPNWNEIQWHVKKAPLSNIDLQGGFSALFGEGFAVLVAVIEILLAYEMR